MDLNEAKTRLADEGYCLLGAQLPASEAERLDGLARSFMKHQEGYISMEGALNQIPELAPLCIHPPILELAEALLGENFILGNNVAMKWCKPGAKAGGLHADWPLGGVPQPWPEFPTILQSFWMLTDFTPENGATVVVPFSHHTKRPPTPNRTYPQEIPIVGKKGSVFLFHNGLWHRSGANTTRDQHRMAANLCYLPWFIHRPKEAWPLVEREVYGGFPPLLQALLVRSAEI
ncbi:MAG: phytanoyl-CoA dioxygenase family protein [Candidatus Poribacteria bacterium]|nr:phytanoyl-CoA dioxygenase family protein [Candidatus Poribacteria bacterium]